MVYWHWYKSFICENEDELQENLIHCRDLDENNKKIPKYEDILNSNVIKKIAKNRKFL